MGREAVQLVAYAAVSKHNSPQDDIDAKTWNNFVASVRELAEDHRHELFIDVSGEEMPIYGWEE